MPSVCYLLKIYVPDKFALVQLNVLQSWVAIQKGPLTSLLQSRLGGLGVNVPRGNGPFQSSPFTELFFKEELLYAN